ncbi:caspase family protein [Microvirga antarctica]|uniref:caspase family protein n=1 Tax=Microvirga antarctica TaxID=2819233 RepID=UPI001B310B67|nr:caspase family protein [Microvirga antarctica]
MAQGAGDLSTCADERVKTNVLPMAAMRVAEAACGRVLAGGPNDADRQKAAFYRSVMRFLQVVTKGAANIQQPNGSVAYSPPTLAQVREALEDIDTAISIDGPLKAEALSFRVAINQVIGRTSEAAADIGQAMQQPQQSASPYVQRALQHERDGDVNAALADLDRALQIDPKTAAALYARGELLRRLGVLDRARADFAATIALGPPFRSLALTRKSELELRAGDLRAAYDDIIAATREPSNMPKTEAADARATLLIQAASLALDKLKEPDIAEKLFVDAQKLTPKQWGPALGLARVAESRGDKPKAIAIYKRIIASTKATPNLYERRMAVIFLKMLTEPLLRETQGIFRDAADLGVYGGKGSPDGLKRVAFIIGESDYSELASLPNARRDAAVMANALAELGFDTVEFGENLKKGDLRKVPAIIAEKAALADVVLVFYAGHGVETGGANYLIPVDAVPDSDEHLANEALALADLSAAAGKAKRGALVIVDACRDDPFVEAREVARSRSTGGRTGAALPARLHAGLAPTPAPAPNSVVFHSTQAGQTALDGAGLDSPFVRAFLETLSAPGRQIDAVVRDTTARVSDRTEGKQVPAAYGTAPAIALLPPAPKR